MFFAVSPPTERVTGVTPSPVTDVWTRTETVKPSWRVPEAGKIVGTVRWFASALVSAPKW
jgi:hypothetical protein